VTGSMGNSDMTSTRLAKGDAASTQSLSSQNSYAVCSELPVQQMHKSLAADRQVDVGKMSKTDRRSALRLLLLPHAPDALDWVLNRIRLQSIIPVSVRITFTISNTGQDGSLHERWKMIDGLLEDVS
jgi:hypothetical protein